MRIGVLALQGDFREHIQTLRKLGVDAVEVRLPKELAEVDGLIIPGGESTTIGKLLVIYDMLDQLRAKAQSGLPIFGTCAGAILLAKDIGGIDQPFIGVMDVAIRRNAFGRQIDSFDVPVEVPKLGGEPLIAVFIRAPRILSVGPGVEVVARLTDGEIVAAQQDNILISSFHPELTDDTRFHRYFVDLVERHSAARTT